MLPVLSLMTSFNTARDIAADPSGWAWAATEGGLILVNEEGGVEAVDARLRDLVAVEVHGGAPWVEQAETGTWRLNMDTGEWVPAGANRVHDAGSTAGCEPTQPCNGESGFADQTGQRSRRFHDAVLSSETGGQTRIPQRIAEAVPLGAGSLVRGVDGTLYATFDGSVDPVQSAASLCGNFVTGLTRWNGDLVVGSFDHGACVWREGEWERLPLPSLLVNEVIAVPGPGGEVLWVATAEGLVRFSPEGIRTVYGVVADEAKRGDPGLNHIGANDLDWDGRALWVADVLGPTRIEETTGGQRWDRYRWSVSGHSYQAIASCGGSVWAGSEDDGLAVRGVAIGSRNGRSDWNHVNVLDGLPEDWIMAIGCAGKNSAWIGTYRSGVGRVDSLGWHPIVGLEGAWVQALATSGDTLWVGTADGLYTVDGGTSRLVSEENVWSILVDGDQIVLGTETGVVVLGTR